MPFLCPRGICRHSTNRDVELLLKPVTFSGKASGSVNQSGRKLLKGFLKAINNSSSCNAVWILCTYFSVFSLVLVLIEKIYQIRGTVFHYITKTSKLFKNITPLQAKFSTIFWAFGNVVRHGMSCLILLMCKVTFALDRFCQWTLAETSCASFKAWLFSGQRQSAFVILHAFSLLLKTEIQITLLFLKKTFG